MSADGLLARAQGAPEAMRAQQAARRADRKVVERLAGLLRALHGSGDIGKFSENGITQRELLHVECVDNTPEEVRAATVEMFNRLDGVHEDSPKAARLRERFGELWRPWAPHVADTAIAASFLETHPALFA